MLARSRSSVSECFSSFAPHLFVLTYDSAIFGWRPLIAWRNAPRDPDELAKPNPMGRISSARAPDDAP
jgi:hypothetical protein